MWDYICRNRSQTKNCVWSFRYLHNSAKENLSNVLSIKNSTFRHEPKLDLWTVYPNILVLVTLMDIVELIPSWSIRICPLALDRSFAKRHMSPGVLSAKESPWESHRGRHSTLYSHYHWVSAVAIVSIDSMLEPPKGGWQVMGWWKARQRTKVNDEKDAVVTNNV